MIKNNRIRRARREICRLKRQEDIVYFAHNIIKSFKNNQIDESQTKLPNLKESLRMLKEIRKEIKGRELEIRIATLSAQRYYVYMDGDDHAAIEHPGTKDQFVYGKNCFKRAIKMAEKQLKLRGNEY